MKRPSTLWLLGLLFWGSPAWADDNNCDVCGELLGERFYFCTDKVEQTKKQLCLRCSELTTVCYLCGVPAFRDFTGLDDGRVLCKRDAQTAVLDEAEARRLCDEMMEALERQFARFTTFPRTNVSVELMDRLRLQEMFKVAGRDYVCPNIWGCTTRRTNDTRRVGFQISLLSGLSRPLLKATCVHEYTHVWILETVSAARGQRLHHDAIEGFCELVAYLAMRAQQEKGAVEDIQRNFYTRGQIHRFIEAEERFGFNEVVEWMLNGEDELLREDDIEGVRRMLARRPGTPLEASLQLATPPLSPVPETLTLRSVLWNPARPMASINDCTFEPGEQARVRVGSTNVLVRCVTIRPDAVIMELVSTGEKRELRLSLK